MLVQELIEASRERPDGLAVCDPVRRLTYQRYAQLARVIRDIVAKETSNRHVGLLLPGSSAFGATFFGTLWTGKVVVPLNFLLSPEELGDIVTDAGLDLVIAIKHFAELANALPTRTIFLEDLPLKRKLVMSAFRSLPDPPAVSPDALAVLLYTSGTSGKCKGVELSYDNLKSNCDAIIESASLTKDDALLGVLPPFHVFGLTGNVLVPVVCKAPAFMIPRFSPTAVLKSLREDKPTVFMAIPSMYGALLRSKSAKPSDFECTRLLISGGEPLPEQIGAGFRDRFGVPLLEGYGMTESSPVIALNSQNVNRSGSVGKPIPGVRVKIVDEQGAEVQENTDGEILVTGPNVMKGYHNLPDETSAVLDSEGWLRTGDIGMIDDDGFLYITGRKKEMIIVGGENVFPREIENAIEQHEAVAESAVIGIPDGSRGEVPVAFVSLTDDASVTDIELRSFVKERLAGFKVPRQIRILDELPRGPTQKVLKRELRELAEASA